MKYKIAICDDREADARYVASAVNRWADSSQVAAEIQIFPSGESFWFHYEEEKDFDILLLDIEMEAISGVELARRIRRDNDGVQIIFITGFSDFMSEGYEVSALHYLMKPVSHEKLREVLDRAAVILNKREESLIFSVDGEALRVAVGDIVCVEAFAHDCSLTTVKTNFRVKMSITAVEKLLVEKAQGEFVRCHRSYIVGIKYIKSIKKADITLDNGMVIPLSRGNYQEVNQAFIRYFKGETQWD